MSRQEKFQKLINGDIPVFIDFHATWCGPCKMMDPVIKELAPEFKGQVRMIKIDIDKNSNLAAQLGIRSVPTFAIYHRGKQLWMKSGMMTVSQLRLILGRHIEEA